MRGSLTSAADAATSRQQPARSQSSRPRERFRNEESRRQCCQTACTSAARTPACSTRQIRTLPAKASKQISEVAADSESPRFRPISRGPIALFASRHGQDCGVQIGRKVPRIHRRDSVHRSLENVAGQPAIAPYSIIRRTKPGRWSRLTSTFPCGGAGAPSGHTRSEGGDRLERDQHPIEQRSSSSDPDATLLAMPYDVTPPRALSCQVHPIRGRPFDVLLVRRMNSRDPEWSSRVRPLIRTRLKNGPLRLARVAQTGAENRASASPAMPALHSSTSPMPN
jgi:hypothetical protein